MLLGRLSIKPEKTSFDLDESRFDGNLYLIVRFLIFESEFLDQVTEFEDLFLLFNKVLLDGLAEVLFWNQEVQVG